MIFHDPATIGLVRLRGSRALASARFHVERHLAASAWRPGSLPSSGILVIRRLVAAAPAQLAGPGHMQASRDWHVSVSASLDRMARSAARPDRGAVPANAEAVLFRDDAELLTCLAVDLAEGTVSTRWWWQDVLRSVPARDVLAGAWMEAPELITATLARLSGRGRVVDVLKLLDRAVVIALVEAVGRRYAIPSVALLATQLHQGAAASSPEDTTKGDSVTGKPSAQARPQGASPLAWAAAPWIAVAPEAGAGELDPPRRSLLGVALALHRAPSLVRSEWFAQALRRWTDNWARGIPDGPEQAGAPSGAPATPSSPPVDPSAAHAVTDVSPGGPFRDLSSSGSARELLASGEGGHGSADMAALPQRIGSPTLSALAADARPSSTRRQPERGREAVPLPSASAESQRPGEAPSAQALRQQPSHVRGHGQATAPPLRMGVDEAIATAQPVSSSDGEQFVSLGAGAGGETGDGREPSGEPTCGSERPSDAESDVARSDDTAGARRRVRGHEVPRNAWPGARPPDPKADAGSRPAPSTPTKVHEDQSASGGQPTGRRDPPAGPVGTEHGAASQATVARAEAREKPDLPQATAGKQLYEFVKSLPEMDALLKRSSNNYLEGAARPVKSGRGDAAVQFRWTLPIAAPAPPPPGGTGCLVPAVRSDVAGAKLREGQASVEPAASRDLPPAPASGSETALSLESALERSSEQGGAVPGEDARPWPASPGPAAPGSRDAQALTSGPAARGPGMQPGDRMGEPDEPSALSTPGLRLPQVGPLGAMIEGRLGESIETGLGGLFYLVNLALYLELYADFSRPHEPGLLISPWDLVALIGRALLGEVAFHASAGDPIWALVARLAGRDPATPPGEGVAPPGEWRVPPSWLRPFEPPGLVRWSAGPRLIVQHAARFAVLDVARQGDAEQDQLAHELAAYPASLREAVRMREEPPPMEAMPPLSRWLSWFVAYVRARLLRALGLDAPGELAPTLLQHRAVVRATDTRVDIELWLEALPVAVRLAGLDRDPGWIPAAGRTIAFHFR